MVRWRGARDEVHPVELLSEVAPGVGGLNLCDAQHEEPEPAQLNVWADAALTPMDKRMKRGFVDNAQ